MEIGRLNCPGLGVARVGNKRRIGRALAAFASLAFVLLAGSCGREAGIEIRFNSLPGEVPALNDAGFDNKVPPPAVPAGGVVYIHTGKDVLGPYAVTPGSPLRIREFPAGAYERLALYYLPAAIPDSPGPGSLPAPLADPAEFWNATAAPEVAGSLLGDSGAVALFADIEVKRGRKLVLEAVLIPLSSKVFSAASDDILICPDSGGAVRKHFIKLDSAGAQSLYIMLSNLDGEGIVYAGTISLYGANGARLETKTFNKEIGTDTPESILFNLPSTGDSWLYFEYKSVGNRGFPFFYF